jgi:hypothetical protein
MKNIKIWNLLQFLGVSIVLLCSFFIEGINQDTVELLGSIGSNRLIIETKDNYINNKNIGFTENEVAQFTDKVKYNETLFTLPFTTDIKANSNTIYTKALAVNSCYKRFADIHIVKGSFLTEKQESNKEKVLVIGEETALKLFKSTDIIGMNISIMNEDFKIVGINKERDSFLSKLFKGKEPQIYIPLKTIFTINEDITIPCLQISISNEYNSIQNEKAVVKLLDKMGKSQSNYKIIDCRVFEKQNLQMIKLIIFVFGILIILHILKTQVKILRTIFSTIKEKYNSQYFLKSIKLYEKIFLCLILRLLFSITSIYVIIQAIKFHFYIVHKSSNNIINYYLSPIIDNILNIGASKLFSTNIINFSIFTINCIFVFGILLGSLLIFTSFYFLKHGDFSSYKPLLFFSISYILSLISASMIINIFKLPIIINTKLVIIIFIFIFLKNISIINRSKHTTIY